MAENVNFKSEAAKREEAILEFWRENKIFEKSLEKKSPRGRYIFYDGPPFATGQIHYGHILGSTAKDVIGRYQTMQGFYVPRKWGWDCHGLPIENIVEKELNIAGHKEIEKYGIDKFVEYARSKVLQYDKDWEKGIERIGRWVDFRGGYKTMDNTFIESVWWALSEFNKKNLIYEGVRVLAYCARCETPIANSEIAMDNSYKDISDISAYVKFELEDPEGNNGSTNESVSDGASEPKTYLLAWTTTPWTLPGNTAIAINKNIDYVKILYEGSNYILAKDAVKNVIKEFNGAEIKIFKGSELIGKKYKPVFPYYKNSEDAKNENIWKIWQADFVTTEKGTGLAHEAPAFGEDDMNLAKKENIPWIIHIDETGRFKPEVVDFAGMQVKPKGDEKDVHQKTDIEIIKYLAKNKTLFAKEKIIHSYPHCMRCDTPIIYYALPSWFINIQKVKENIIKQSNKINWIPSHLKEGRFKNIIENAPDWNISRNRYWASPLPIWKCQECKKQVFISSLEDLKNKTKKSGNKYFLMRHGETDTNLKNLVSTIINSGSHLTEKGKKKTMETAEILKKEGIDIIFISPFNRTKETAEIIQEILGLGNESVYVDERLGEMMVKSYEGKTWDQYHRDFPKTAEYFSRAKDGDESLQDVKKRMMNFLFELEEKYQNKRILIITHGGPVWLATAGARMLDVEGTLALVRNKKDFYYLGNSEMQKLSFTSFPHNENYELDLHRPYIDEISLVCNCGGELMRIPEVLDCWFESGSMPFAQDHYPFSTKGGSASGGENSKWQKNNFPAGFVAEYIAQTRTWFYYTHTVSTVLFNQAPFKNVVTTGTLRAEDGEKMSKSKNNYPDPWIFINKYGVDALRIYLMSSILMKGEDANFSEKAVQDIASKIIGRLFNVLAFYELYRDEKMEASNISKSKNILDRWILSRFYQILNEITEGMKNYDIAEAVRPIDSFVDDFSTWYLRRSRERIKNGDKEAKQTLYFVLKNLAKLMAPFTPFTAEDIWLKLRNENDTESVHLVKWPANQAKWFLFSKKNVMEKMQTVRDIVTFGLEARQNAGIKVRQSLAKLEIKNHKLSDEYLELIKDELNVKEVIQNKNIENQVKLDINITSELKQEGDYRELVRALQDMRKKMGLTPSDVVSIIFETNEAGKKLVQKFETEMKKTALVSKVEFGKNNGQEIKIDDLIFKVKINK